MTQENEQVDIEPSEEAAAEAPPESGSELENLQTERDKYLDLLQRSQAEFDNFRKRTSRERSEWQEMILGNFVGQLLPIIDNYERAMQALALDQNPEDFKQGMNMILQDLTTFLTTNGITKIESDPGMTFDPELHQAVFQDTSGSHKPGQITNVAAPGYRLKNRVVRHAQVAVAAVPPEEGDAPEEEGEQSNVSPED